MIALVSVGSYRARGRLLFVVRGVPNLDPRTLQNCVIALNDRTVRVVGVETDAILDVTGRSFALMIEPAAR